MEKVKCISYVRFSSEAQAQGDSVRRQLKLSEEWLAKHPEAELDTSISCRDLGVSAFKGKNQSAGLGLILKAADQGKIKPGSILLVESLDRLSRQQIREAMDLFFKIVSKGIRIITLMDGQEYNERNINDLGPLIVSLTIMFRAHEESRTKSIRVSEAWRKKRANAEKEVITARGPSWLRLNEDRKWEPDPDKVATINRIVQLYLDGNGTEQICKILNREGVPTLNDRAKVWNNAGPIKIIKSRALIGEYQPKVGRKPVGDPIPNYYPRVVLLSDFNKMQIILAKNGASAKKKAGGRGGVCSLFTHVVKCMRCGSPMHYYHGRRNHYLWCSLVKKGGDCAHHSWNYKDFEARFLGMVDEVVSITGEEDGRVREIQEQLAETASAMSTLEKRIVGWQDAIGDAPTQSIRQGLMKRIEVAESELEELRSKKKTLNGTLSMLSNQNAERDLHELKELAKDSKNEAIRRKIIAQIRLLIDRIEVDTTAKLAQVHFKTGYVRTMFGKGVNSETVHRVLGDKVFSRSEWDDETDVVSYADELGNIISKFIPKDLSEPLTPELLEEIP